MDIAKYRAVISEGETPEYGVAALVAAWQLQQVELLRQYVQAPQLTETIQGSLEALKSYPEFLEWLLLSLGRTHPLIRVLAQEALDVEKVWAVIVEWEEIPQTLSATFNTATGQIKSPLPGIEVFQIQELPKFVQLLREQVLSVEVPVQLKLAPGSLRSYEAFIREEEFLQQVDTPSLSKQLKAYTKGPLVSGVAMMAAMLVGLSACGPLPPTPEPREVPVNNSPDCIVKRSEFYQGLYSLRSGMTEEEVDRILDPRREYRKRSYSYAISYEILGFDYSVMNVVTCEAVQIHYDSQWKFRFYTVRTYPL